MNLAYHLTTQGGNDPADHLRRQWEQETAARKYGKPARDNTRVERAGLIATVNKLHELGYNPVETVYHCPFDLWIERARIEVKSAQWYHDYNRGGGHYKANVRKPQIEAADLVIWVCKVPPAFNERGWWHWFIIPTIGLHTENLKITSAKPWQYRGQWADFYNYWGLLDYIIQCRQEQTKDQEEQLWLPELTTSPT